MSDDQPEPSPAKDDGNADKSADFDECSDNMNLFASVWVKIEVNEEDQVQIKSEPAETTTSALAEQELRRGPYKKNNPKEKNLKCEQCDYRTSHKNCLAFHTLSHSNTKPFACAQCDYKTKYPMSLKRHIIVKHEDLVTAKEKLPVLRCGLCSYETHFKWNLNSHERKHDLSKQHKCPECSYTTAYKHSLKKHSRTHNKKPVGITYFCDKCPFTTKHEGHISRHMAQVHFEVSEKASQCEHCNFSTKTGWRLNTHRKRSRQENPIKCVHCDYQSLYRCAFKEHIRLNHTDANQQWLDSLFAADTCLQNQKEDTTEGQASEIMKMCEIRSKLEANAGTSDNLSLKMYNELKSKVNEDPTYYTIQNSLQNHPQQTDSNDKNESLQDTNLQMSEHGRNNHYLLDPNCEVAWSNIQVIECPNQDRPFKCIICNYTSKFKASVQRHYQRHHNSQNRPYKCANCDFSTKTKDQIALHNRRSKSDDVLTCKICGYNSVFRCQFAMHEKEHNPFKCVSCRYTCKKKPDMQKHFTIVHLGKGLKCSHCDFKALRKESLLVHEVIHTGNKPFKCQLCDYSSVRRFLLENHINRFHKIEIADKETSSNTELVSDDVNNEKLLQNIV